MKQMEPTIKDLNSQLVRLVNTTNELLRSSQERTEILVEDSKAQASRVMAARCKAAGEELVSDFKNYLKENEWPEKLQS